MVLYWKGLPRLVVPRMVPPRGRMPLTSLSVSSHDFSGQIRPSKPSGMPITFHLYLRMAHLTAARMTALRPGASPPPVQMPMQWISDMRSQGAGSELRLQSDAHAGQHAAATATKNSALLRGCRVPYQALGLRG